MPKLPGNHKTKAVVNNPPPQTPLNDALHHLAFDHSAQPNLISIVSNGLIISANAACCELLGYPIKELLTKSRSDIFDVGELSFTKMMKQRAAVGRSTAEATGFKKNRKSFRCMITSAVFLDEDGIEKSITTIVDQNPQILLEKNNIWIKNIAKNSYDVMWDWNIATGIMYVGDSIEEVFGYRVKSNTIRFKDCLKLFIPGESVAIEKKLELAIHGDADSWNDAFKMKRRDGSIANISARASIIRNDKGKAIHMVGSIQDITRIWEMELRLKVQLKKETKLETQLANEISHKEMQVANAMEDARDAERSSIGQELHDNINQLLGASRLYLDIAKKGGAASQAYLNKSSEYTLMAINEIRNLSRGLVTDTIKNLGLIDAIRQLTNDTMETSSFVIKCSTRSFIEKVSGSKFQLNIFRIIQEQLSNIIKHARCTIVRISLSQNTAGIILTIEDNGIGFDKRKCKEGIGLINMISRANAFNGTLKIRTSPGKGCTITVRFPVSNDQNVLKARTL